MCDDLRDILDRYGLRGKYRESLPNGGSPFSGFNPMPGEQPDFTEANDDSRFKPFAGDHAQHERSDDNSSTWNSGPRQDEGSPGGPTDPNFYALVGAPYRASQAEILRAVKRARIANHPDRVVGQNLPLKDMEKVVERAKCVGQACDMLEDPRQRMIYDEKMRREKLPFYKADQQRGTEGVRGEPFNPFQGLWGTDSNRNRPWGNFRTSPPKATDPLFVPKPSFAPNVPSPLQQIWTSPATTEQAQSRQSHSQSWRASTTMNDAPSRPFDEDVEMSNV